MVFVTIISLDLTFISILHYNYMLFMMGFSLESYDNHILEHFCLVGLQNFGKIMFYHPKLYTRLHFAS